MGVSIKSPGCFYKSGVTLGAEPFPRETYSNPFPHPFRWGSPKGVEDSDCHSRIYCNQWPFQDPRLEVPTIYKAYVRPM